MLTINTTINGDKALMQGLRAAAEEAPVAIKKALSDIAGRANTEAIRNLQGPKRGVQTVTSKSGRQRVVAMNPQLAGGYPVPRLTGNLLRLLDKVSPGRSKTANGVTFTAGAMEAIVFNAAEYSEEIHEGRGTSKKYGARPYLTDALEKVKPEINTILEERVNEITGKI